MSRVAVVVVGCLVVLAGCQAPSSSACPAVGPDGETVEMPVCADEQAGGLSLSLDQNPGTVSITVKNVGDEVVLVNPDRWTVFRKASSGQHASERKWRVAANAPAGTHNLTVVELASGETVTWELTYEQTAADPQNHRDRTLAKSGQYAFSLAVDGRTYTGSFQVGT